uniref:Hypothetical chloroplast RF54 n=1 Tax=Gastroclonium compressum TaxID=1852973 RepID=A0A173FZS7_GASCM|nr:hypothetical chloroplast RF54 [Coeloseira compressa]ANH09536.1 hypothetical chloroplast RF54 [Coeloseira compressa]
MYNYYFAIGSKKFLMNQEPLEEILRERKNYYKSINKDIDFWLILDVNIIPCNLNTEQSTNCLAAIISLDKQFIQWLKLRIGFVNIGNFQSKNILNFSSKSHESLSEKSFS